MKIMLILVFCLSIAGTIFNIADHNWGAVFLGVNAICGWLFCLIVYNYSTKEQE